MDTQVLISEALKLEVSSIILGWIAIVGGFVIKDILTSVAFGLMFYLDPQFQEGDTVYIDGEKSIISKIGITTTIFKIIETSRWRYVKNGSIRKHKLEKQMEGTK